MPTDNVTRAAEQSEDPFSSTRGGAQQAPRSMPCRELRRIRRLRSIGVNIGNCTALTRVFDLSVLRAVPPDNTLGRNAVRIIVTRGTTGARRARFAGSGGADMVRQM
jgi:hypothetical protein